MEDEYLNRALKLCALRDYCIKDVSQKLNDWGANKDEIQEIISFLLKKKFLDENRYAENFALGKVKGRRWGKNKIRQHLLQKGISAGNIENAFNKVGGELYATQLKKLAQWKWNFLEKETDLYKRKQKLQRFLISKGYGMDEAIGTVNALFE